MKENQLCKGEKIMLPLWLAYPKIERYSIGWRMGVGEDYAYKFFKWFDKLTKAQKEEYRMLFPEPVTWAGWWKQEESEDEELVEEGEYMEQGDFYIQLWQPKGEPKYSCSQLQQETADGKEVNFAMFWGHRPAADGSVTKSCLSQWWQESFYYGITEYCCMEQFMMAQKALLFGDKEVMKEIMECRDPGKIKSLGRKVKGFDPSVWDKAKYAIVLNGNWCKFSQNPRLKHYLLSTKDRVLVEASPYDVIWGIGLSADAPDANDPMKWRGQNLLGFALMEVRDELRRVGKNEHLGDRCEVEEL